MQVGAECCNVAAWSGDDCGCKVGLEVPAPAEIRSTGETRVCTHQHGLLRWERLRTCRVVGLRWTIAERLVCWHIFPTAHFAACIHSLGVQAVHQLPHSAYHTPDAGGVQQVRLRVNDDEAHAGLVG